MKALVIAAAMFLASIAAASAGPYIKTPCVKLPDGKMLLEFDGAAMRHAEVLGYKKGSIQWLNQGFEFSGMTPAGGEKGVCTIELLHWDCP